MPDTIQTQSIPVEKIKSSPHQTRTTFDDATIQELAANVKEHGLINPISVRPLADGTWELIAGERRLRAVKLNGGTTIDARVFPNVADQDASLMGMIENLQRDDLTPIEEAQGYKQLADRGMDNAAIGRVIGKGREVISRALDLLELPPEVQASVTRGTLTERHTRSIRQIPDKAKQIALAQQGVKEGWSVKQTEEAVNKVLDPKGEKKDGKGAKKGSTDPFADVWPKLLRDNKISACNYWTVEFNKDGWNFKASATKFAAPEDFAAWFRQMAQALSPAPVAVSTPVARAPAPVTAPPPHVVQASQPPPVPKAPTMIAPARVAVPIPEPQEATYISGDRMQIKWADLGPGYTYQVMWTDNPERPRFEPVPSSPTVKTPGAIVNIFSAGQSKKVLLAVQAIDPGGHPSELSQPVEFDLKPWNNEWTVLSLPLNVMKPQAMPAPAPKPVAAATPEEEELDPEVAAMVAEHVAKGGLK